MRRKVRRLSARPHPNLLYASHLLMLEAVGFSAVANVYKSKVFSRVMDAPLDSGVYLKRRSFPY